MSPQRLHPDAKANPSSEYLAITTGKVGQSVSRDLPLLNFMVGGCARRRTLAATPVSMMRTRR